MYNINLLKWYVKVGETYFFFFTKSKERRILKDLELLFTLQNYEKKTCSNNQHSIDLFAKFAIYVVEREKRSTVDV